MEIQKRSAKRKVKKESKGSESATRNAMQSKRKLVEEEDVVTSESESEAEIEERQNIAMEQESTSEAKRREPEFCIFVGNLPNTVRKAGIMKLFKPYGTIRSVRFRTQDGVIIWKRTDLNAAKSLICFIRFAEKQDAIKACDLNGTMFMEHRIRVSMHDQKQFGNAKTTVFVGNIAIETTDNELYDFFSTAGDIEYVRQIPNKGIGYVCYKKGAVIAKVLKLNGQMLNRRALRVMKLDPNTQMMRKNKKGNWLKKHQDAANNTNVGDTRSTPNPSKPKSTQVGDYHGAVSNKKKQKNKRLKQGNALDKKIISAKLKAAAMSK